MKPAMGMHPIKPALDGKDLSDFKAPNGKWLFVEESATNMHMVSTAVEEMSATIKEISRKADEGNTIAAHAVSQATEAIKSMR